MQASIESAFKHIVHPTDFSPDSTHAFVHALRIGLAARSHLHILHVAPRRAHADWREFPRVRELLIRWGRLAPGATRESVSVLGLKVRKTMARGDDPTQTLVDELEHRAADLLVLGTHPHEGLARLWQKEVAVPVARAAGQRTLFVPHGSAGFVDSTDGTIKLTRVLIPFDHLPPVQPAIEACVALLELLDLTDVHCTLLHVGPPGELPGLTLPALPGLHWDVQHLDGAPVERVLEAAAQGTDLIVMSTEGRHGFMDALQGSTTEQIVRRSPCPVLAIHALRVAG